MARFWAGINPWVRLAGGVVLASVVLPIVWYLGSPLLFDRRVNEAFPVSSSRSGSGAALGAEDQSAASKPMGQPAGTTGDTIGQPAASEPMGQTAGTTGDTMGQPAASEPVEQPAGTTGDTMGQPAGTTGDTMGQPAASEPVGQPAGTTGDTMGQPAASEPVKQPAALPTVATEAVVPAPEARTEPIALRSGSFGSMNDGIHKGEGRATVYELPDGTRFLRLEDFNVTNGPDLRVYLSADPRPRSSDALTSSDAVEIAPLKGNIGDQNYDLPAGFDPARFRSVVIYCKRFHVLVSIASFEG